MITPGQKYLITTEEFFVAPDGEEYRSAHGTVHAIVDAESALGIRTNARSTNWYAICGDMIIAGCQIHYVTRTDRVSFDPSTAEGMHEGNVTTGKRAITRIWDADASSLIPVTA